MRVVGRILQAVGWVWVIAGFVGPVFGLDAPNFFPGIILLFVSRIFRANAARSESLEDDREAAETQPERILNTDRAPTPPARPAPPKPEPIFDEPAIEPEDIASEEGLFERILLAGTAGADEIAKRSDHETDAKPKSSQDMIAEARERWGKKP